MSDLPRAEFVSATNYDTVVVWLCDASASRHVTLDPPFMQADVDAEGNLIRVLFSRIALEALIRSGAVLPALER